MSHERVIWRRQWHRLFQNFLMNQKLSVLSLNIFTYFVVIISNYYIELHKKQRHLGRSQSKLVQRLRKLNPTIKTLFQKVWLIDLDRYNEKNKWSNRWNQCLWNTRVTKNITHISGGWLTSNHPRTILVGYTTLYEGFIS